MNRMGIFRQEHSFCRFFTHISAEKEGAYFRLFFNIAKKCMSKKNSGKTGGIEWEHTVCRIGEEFCGMFEWESLMISVIIDKKNK